MALGNAIGIGIPMVNLGLGGGGGESFLLDDYPNTGGYSYSLRQLSSTVTSVVRVRRSSDNTEQDFTAAEITDGTLASFCGVGEGFVAKWYDQSNSADVYNLTALQQPKIVSGGSVILENGKPCMEFDGVDDSLGALISPPYASSYYLFAVNTFVSVPGGAKQYVYGLNLPVPPLGLGIDMSFRLTPGLPSSTLSLRGTSDNNGSIASPLAQGLYYNRQSTESIINLNGSNISIPSSNGGASIDTVRMGSTTNNNGYSNVRLQEFVLYLSDPGLNASPITEDINNHYSIF